MPRRHRLRRFAEVLAAAAVLLPLAALVRARFLPEVEVPVLRYARLAENATDADTVALADFFSQLEDLLEGGFESVTPRRLRQYAIWGRRLPLRPATPPGITAQPGAASRERDRKKHGRAQNRKDRAVLPEIKNCSRIRCGSSPFSAA